MFPKEPFGASIPTFDIFRGHYLDREATWIEAVDGLAQARARLKQIAAEKPGAYFVFSSSDRLVLEIVNTGKALERPSSKHKAAGAA